MDPVKDSVDTQGAELAEAEFKCVELGTVTEETRGMEGGLTVDGGDPPFHRLICFPC